jgi:hypothetical protein
MKHRKILLVLVALAGCGNDPSPLTVNQFIQKRAEAVCAGLSPACLMTSDICMAARIAEYQAEYQAAIASFRDFIPSNGDACLAQTRDVYGKIKDSTFALKGTDYERMLAVCANVYRGTSAVNGPCQISPDCLGDLICDKSFCANAKQVGAGANCGNPGEYCPRGSYCSQATGVWVCTAKVGAQGSCVASPCIETLRCAGGLCVDLLDFGAVCASDTDCASGFCEPYAAQCANDIRFAKGTPACIAMGGS